MPKKEEPLSIRFERKITKGGDAECWNWIGGDRHPFGYGRMSVRSPAGRWIMELSHRIAYLLRFGEVPAGMCVLHRCDNPACCNPDHLFLGTHADNIADKVAKGRQQRGEKAGGVKLTEQQVFDIKRTLAPYAGRRVRRGIVRDLAEKHGVCRAAITHIGKGQAWRSAA